MGSFIPVAVVLSTGYPALASSDRCPPGIAAGDVLNDAELTEFSRGFAGSARGMLISMTILKRWFRANPRDGLQSVAALLTGGAIGLIAWLPPDHFVALWLLPLVWHLCGKVRDRSLLALAYYVAALVSSERTMASFFPHASLVITAGTWLVCAVLLWLPYAIAAAYLRPGPAWVVGLIVTAVPPLGVIGMVSPLFAATASFPGAGLLGLVGCIAGQWLLASGFGGARRGTAAAVLLSVALLCLALLPTPTGAGLPMQQEWKGISSALGKTPDIGDDWIARQTLTIARVNRELESMPRGSVLLTPEDIAGPWTALSGVLWYHTDQLAARRHDTLLLGVTLSADHHHRWLDALVMLGAQHGRIAARQPIPVAEWRPFMRNDFQPDWLDFGATSVAGTPVAMLVCYEQMLIWPAAWSWLHGPAPHLILAPANHGWAVLAGTETNIQRSAALALGRLFGVPVILADNVPVPR